MSTGKIHELETEIEVELCLRQDSLAAKVLAKMKATYGLLGVRCEMHFIVHARKAADTSQTRLNRADCDLLARRGSRLLLPRRTRRRTACYRDKSD